MTATTTDRAITWYPDGNEFSYPVYQATKIPQGVLVSLNSSGYAVNSTNAAEKFVGVSSSPADNTDGASAALYVTVRRRGVCSMITSGAGLTSPGTDMYCTDNQTVQTTANNLYVGKFVKYTSATECLLDISNATTSIPAPEDTDETVSLPVAATTNIAINDLVYSLATGYATPGATTADLKLEGIALAAADNSAGGAGDIDVSVKRCTHPVTHLTTSGAGATDIGALVWATGAQAVSTTAGNNLVGVITKVVSATSVYVDLKPALNKSRPSLGRHAKVLYAGCPTPATTPGVDVTTKLELMYKAMLLRAYMTSTTAPGGSDTLVGSISDGTTTKTVTITGSATEAEDEDLDKGILLANQDITINFTRTGSTAVGGHFWVEYEEL